MRKLRCSCLQRADHIRAWPEMPGKAVCWRKEGEKPRKNPGYHHAGTTASVKRQKFADQQTVEELMMQPLQPQKFTSPSKPVLKSSKEPLNPETLNP